MQPIKVVAYARVSSKEQAQKDLSIPYQLQQIRKFCIDRGFNLVREYVDEGKSAKTADRPAFQKIIGTSKSKIKSFDGIVVHKIDRFSRNNEDHVIYRALLKQYGVKVYSVSEPYDDDTPHGFLSNGILQLISEFYNMNLATEVKKGMTENAKRGYHNGGIPPYGYTTAKVRDANNNEKTIWVPGREEDVAIVQRIFNMYVYQNMGVKRIVNALNNEGVPSPNCGLWSKSTVTSILHNDTYIGVRTWNRRASSASKEKYKPQSEWVVKANAHPPLISRDVFYMVREKGQQRNPAGNANWTPNGPSPYILRGMLKCPKCGANMVCGRNSIKNRGYSMYYFCGTYDRKGKDACERGQVIKTKIEKAVIDTLIREFSILSFPGTLEHEVKRFQEEKFREYEHELNLIRGDRRHLEQKIKIASSESITEETSHSFTQYISQLEQELESVNKQEKTLEEINAECVINPDVIEIARDKMKDFVNRIRIEPPEIQWKLLNQYVNFIAFDEFNRSYKMKLVIPGTMDGEGAILGKTIFFYL